MKEWCKKHLGWVGFGVWVAFTLIALLGRFILNLDHYDDLALIGFLIMITAQLIQDILNETYFKKYSGQRSNVNLLRK